MNVTAPPKIRSKLPDIGTTIFSVMTNLANSHDAINLSQGFPDFDVPPDLITLVEKYMRAGHNQYAPMPGVEILRQRIAQKVQKLYHATYDPESEITVTSGATESLFAAISAVVQPGDEVILFEPAFDVYLPAITLSGGVPVFLKLKFPEYRIDWNELQKTLTRKTRLIVLNSPHNPTGTILTEEDLITLAKILENNSALILSDEVYEHIIFDDLQHESVARHPELAQRSLIVSSFGKTYHTTGWKVGYCLAPKSLSEEFRKIHQFLTFATNTPIQYAYAEFMLSEHVYLNLGEFYQARRDKFLALIEKSRFKPLSCRGTYFLMVDYSEISSSPDIEFSKKLTLEHGVASIPPSVFYNQNDDYRVLRFCFAKKDETLKRAAERLCQV